MITAGRPKKHGKARSRVYKIWENMKTRCLNPKSINYKFYGGRGITLCDRWLKFENFYADMGNDNGLTIDRKENDKGYFKENCKWSTKSEQQRNKRHYGKTKYTGVYINGEKFQARIKYKNKIHYIGTFETPKLASLAFEACKSVLYTSREQ